jgi:UDP-N-acetylglucosamine 2-epimerase (non-hydrolysing)
MKSKRLRIAVVMGTRPEAIKMAPVVHALKEQPDQVETVVIATAQHRQMLDQVLSLFQIPPDVDLDLMRPQQTLADLTARVLQMLELTLRDLCPDLLLVQGDTTTVFAASLAAFYLRIPVGHVEAGLRSHDLLNPFPEEANRCLTSKLTALHFAPTPLACQELLCEGVSQDKIVVTGNTVVDALHTLLAKPLTFYDSPLAHIPFNNHRIVLVTSHRRESWGQELHNTCLALKDLVERFSDVLVVYPVHLNPNVRQTVMAVLSGTDRICLTEPLNYLTFLNLMARAHLILTDSGGIQEEAPTLHKPLLVLRKLTERPEAFQAGLAKIVGTSREAIVEEASQLLTDPEAYRAMSCGSNPYGDGHASKRIMKAINRWAQGKSPLLAPEEEFNFATQVAVALKQDNKSIQ